MSVKYDPLITGLCDNSYYTDAPDSYPSCYHPEEWGLLNDQHPQADFRLPLGGSPGWWKRMGEGLRCTPERGSSLEALAEKAP